ncbi:inositol 1,4,5-triphosphate receptor associated 2 isoform X2 [Synchiropus splendidus]|uniref:inositol 1,4,5-triphosphate receptor associated 2 isoform X2 n=1 Tax=Synchiropus splendidus TaxID=270530 RepID=UPI00237EC5FA|nr:inositol 1,4,5-triphosphate receptor associated 2 isoform X2 [Synchiropus splendidus]
MSETNGPAIGQSWASSDDSEEEPKKLEPMSTSWNELSIIERVGLNSAEMSEADLEAAFSQIAMAFRCDQYTLKQRLQAEEHARNLAEENIQLELSRGRETLETLKGLCLDSKRSKILQRLELSLDILAGTVERISSTAEVLGAVHQEARVSRAVELMVAHVQNLRRSHHRHKTELQEAQKTIQRQSSCRNLPRNSDSPDLLDSDTVKENFKPNCSRRRVSVSLLPNQIQEKVKQNPKKPPTTDGSTCGSVSSCKDDSCPTESRLTGSAEAAARPPDSCPNPGKVVTPRKIHHKSVPAEALRHRHRNKPTLTKRKADKDQAGRHVPVAPAASVWKRLPLSLLLFSLLVGMTLVCLLWKHHLDALEPGEPVVT